MLLIYPRWRTLAQPGGCLTKPRGQQRSSGDAVIGHTSETSIGTLPTKNLAVVFGPPVQQQARLARSSAIEVLDDGRRLVLNGQQQTRSQLKEKEFEQP